MAAPAQSTAATPAGAGDAGEPELCPYCATPLPPDFVPSATQGAAAGPSTQADGESASAEAPAGSLLEPRARPQISTATLKQSLDSGEGAETSATSAIISADDIRRWSSIAGVPVVASPVSVAPLSPAPARAQEATAGAGAPPKAIPLLPPPPGRSSGRNSPARFGFFSRGRSKLGMSNSDDSDSGGEASPAGYARVAGPGSDDDEDDDGYESDKWVPGGEKKADKGEEKEEETGKDDMDQGKELDQGEKESTEAARAPTSVDLNAEAPAISVTANTPATPADDLRKILGEVLSRVQVLTTTHNELLASHSTLLTSMKIARSNLIMAEANTEMLEDELKRLKVSHPARPNSGDTPRASIDKTKELAPRPSSSQLSVSTTSAGGKSSSGFGFWKKSSTGTGPDSPTEPTGPVSDTRDDEVRTLRAQLDSQGDELEALKKGKKAIEAELEGLSQALFEEANKMVADERRRRAEIEDALREAKDEREALRQTVRVLGGRVQTPAGTPAAEMSEGEAMDNLETHYAALRRGIHHAVDPSDESAESGSDSGTGSEAEVEEQVREDMGRARSDTVTTLKPSAEAGSSDSESGGNAMGATLETGIPEPKTLPLAAEANPWG